MSNKKEIKIGLFLAGTGHHIASWRHPKAVEDGAMNLPYLINLAQTAEKGKLDMIFLADSLSVNKNSHPNIITRFEPLTLLTAMAGATKHIGLAATASTTYSEPFHIARQFASLDHLSSGRAGWNVVTSSIPQTGLNFSKTEHLEHDKRYERAEEFVEIVKGLWDSWEESAFIRNKEDGKFINEDKMHELGHKGEFFSVQGPLNIARAPQGYPVIIQAGSSPAGQALAAQIAEVIFTAQNNIEDAKKFYKGIKEQVRSFGRNPDEVLVMPGIFPIIGDTEEEAHAKYQELQDLIPVELGLSILSNYLGGIDLTQYPLQSRFSDLNIEKVDGVQSRYELIKKMAEKDDLTLEQLYKSVAGSRGHHIFIGTPEQLADKMEEWVEGEACDGFNLMPPLLPEGLETFVEKVVPILQERGVYRKEYEGKTLRDHLGLKEPKNRYASN
ncbi:LLM class flavin-dependent oxidoreductase [Priestia filamentosa]|uniref:LLM class flavin-dependent oxidoreductase n=1 Tax=Priestia filamentosa TaxID=1402861 RepID=UPI001C1E59FC|nr:LLM class flavin-dependent oxidoreductase [Priestia filamentosa]